MLGAERLGIPAPVGVRGCSRCMTSVERVETAARMYEDAATCVRSAIPDWTADVGGEFYLKATVPYGRMLKK